MQPDVKYDEGNDTYELGISVDGTFVSVFTIAGSTVRARIEAAQQQQQQPQPGTATPGTEPAPPA